MLLNVLFGWRLKLHWCTSVGKMLILAMPSGLDEVFFLRPAGKQPVHQWSLSLQPNRTFSGDHRLLRNTASKLSYRRHEAVKEPIVFEHSMRYLGQELAIKSA